VPEAFEHGEPVWTAFEAEVHGVHYFELLWEHVADSAGGTPVSVVEDTTSTLVVEGVAAPLACFVELRFGCFEFGFVAVVARDFSGDVDLVVVSHGFMGLRIFL
jgi:hypothetical protein